VRPRRSSLDGIEGETYEQTVANPAAGSGFGRQENSGINVEAVDLPRSTDPKELDRDRRWTLCKISFNSMVADRVGAFMGKRAANNVAARRAEASDCT